MEMQTEGQGERLGEGAGEGTPRYCLIQTLGSHCGRECDGSIPGVVGSAVSAAGFPIGVIPFGDDEPPTLSFNGYCSCAPACPGSCTQGMPAFLRGTPLCQMPVLLGAAAAVAVLLACAGFGVHRMCKKKQAPIGAHPRAGGGDDLNLGLAKPRAELHARVSADL